MQIEFTGRQVVIHAKLRTQAKAGLDRIEKIIGGKSTAHVILTEEKFRKVAEVTIQCKSCGDLTAKCVDKEMEKALHDALDKVEKQALKLVKKAVKLRRHPEKSAVGSVRLQTSDDNLDSQPGILARQRVAKIVPAKKAVKRVAGSPHLVRIVDGVAMRPMNLDQAVKAAAQSERDVFIFRDSAGLANVLYRRRDGRVEWIEVP